MIQLFSHEDDDKPLGSGNKLRIKQAHKNLQKLTSELKSHAKAFAAEDVPRSEQEQNLQRVAMVRLLLDERQSCTSELLNGDAWRSFIMAFVKILMDEENSPKIAHMAQHRQRHHRTAPRPRRRPQRTLERFHFRMAPSSRRNSVFSSPSLSHNRPDRQTHSLCRRHSIRS
ncbi:hypothetical protein V8C42DRAFT_331578 [Trichoderma barbatum]